MKSGLDAKDSGGVEGDLNETTVELDSAKRAAAEAGAVMMPTPPFEAKEKVGGVSPCVACLIDDKATDRSLPVINRWTTRRSLPPWAL